jgi:trk system potassium uptake protein TrkH
MKIRYKSTKLNRLVIVISILTSAAIAATFVLLYGFDEPVIAPRILHIVQIAAFFVLLAKKAVKLLNAYSKKEFIRQNWYEIPAITILLIVVFGAGTWFPAQNAGKTVMLALGVYLLFEVIAKACQGSVYLASTGRNPTTALITIFMILITVGAGFLMLPKSYNCRQMSFVDALFTATSATCVTGLIVKDTGSDFTAMGQMVILSLIQLGGLGLVIFGAVLALLLGQALSVRESVAMQDLLNTRTLGKIGTMIGFIFAATIIIEALGAVLMYPMWDTVPQAVSTTSDKWFCSVFHSISAFCNAGFSLFSTSMTAYNDHWAVYGVMAPLIVLGGLGFGVLYNIFSYFVNRIHRLYRRKRSAPGMFVLEPPQRLQLQTKIVLSTSLILILAGTAAIMLFENAVNDTPGVGYSLTANGKETTEQKAVETATFESAFFQSITARTAGFNTVDISKMTPPTRFTLMILMFIGGSPGSTAGGIKTVTFAVLVMVVWATMKKRTEVEIFKRSVRLVVLGRAITVALLLGATLVATITALAITEKQNAFEFGDIVFEAGSALGTVGLSTGITPSLTTAGKLIIIAAMLIGRLGPLTLLASLTFNWKAHGYNYPDEPLVVG